MKIACWNVNSLKVRLQQVRDWCAASAPDVLCLQETKTVDENFPVAELKEAGYTAAYSGQKTYNGVAVLVREPLSFSDPVAAFPDFGDEQKRLLAVTCNEVRVINVYVPNGKEVDDEKYYYKLQWFERLLDFVECELQTHRKLVVTGDFNIAPEDIDVHDPELWAGKILCSASERECFARLIDLGMFDAFRQFEQPEQSFSWWDYRAAGFRRNLGLRIDHIVISEELRQLCTSCEIDRQPRAWERPSDHTPVMAKFNLQT